ncbi:hypothetical protein ACTG15_13680 [Aeromonas sp. 164P]
MSQEERQIWRWRRGLRLVVALIVWLILLGVLVGSYQQQRDAVQQTSLARLSGHFAERAQRLHGLWLINRRPPQLLAEGVWWHFGSSGWPIGVGDRQEGDGDCQALWQQLIGVARIDGEPLQVTALPAAAGCGWSLGERHWHYRWQGGEVRVVDTDNL